MNDDPPKQAERRRRTRAIALTLFAIPIAVGLLVAAFVSHQQAADRVASSAAPSGHGIPREVRTVIVGSTNRNDLSSPNGPVLALHIDGPVPRTSRPAVVVTDEDCAADRRGISHCLNKLRLTDGALLTVRHSHRLSDVGCLTPGEHVRVRAA